MKIVPHFSDQEGQRFHGDVVRGVTGRIIIGKDDGADNFCMRVFTIEPEGFTPCHVHEWEHEIFFHQGNGQVLQGGEWKDVSAGSVVFVPGNEEHQIRNNAESELTFVCLVPKGAPEL
ncbi:MAG: cupin [Desulfobacterales bacterium]|nr:MAG: cupin [Desulfobacterales bacterium]